jgi:hypothetical protein
VPVAQLRYQHHVNVAKCRIIFDDMKHARKKNIHTKNALQH